MAERKLRTAVLVVHGMGSQRPLATVSGIVNAVWFDNDKHDQDTRRVWTHPQPSGVDIDLTVKTTSAVEGTSGARNIDFHELYWAHHMSETKAVAVLLWLFELGRRGPHFKTDLNGLWWCGAVYLCLLLLSVTLIALQILTRFADMVHSPYGVFIVTLLMALAALIYVMRVAARKKHLRLVGLLRHWIKIAAVAAAILAAVVGVMIWLHLPVLRVAEVIANVSLVPVIASCSAMALMGSTWGWRAMRCALGVSLIFFALYVLTVLATYYLGSTTPEAGIWACVPGQQTIGAIFCESRFPWSLRSDWSSVAALTLIGLYLVINAAFLQPYLGDAARYFRNSPANVAVRRAIRKDAVDTLDQLHRSRDYDRIVVVAHSLGTAVAYDMVRAYYSRMCRQIRIGSPDLNPEFDAIDRGSLDHAAHRATGRKLITKFVEASKMLSPASRGDDYKPAATQDVDAWLVTDFVTLGSPLTHAYYLATDENDGDKIDEEFAKRVREREFPVCPPARLDRDGALSFVGSSGKPRLHHGGVFGLTRWTNLYFPAIDIFWGDAIGGPVAPFFGAGVQDVPVWTDCAQNTDNFKHTSYWTTDCEPDKRNGPHITALRKAVNLEDK